MESQGQVDKTPIDFVFRNEDRINATSLSYMSSIPLYPLRLAVSLCFRHLIQTRRAIFALRALKWIESMPGAVGIS